MIVRVGRPREKARRSATRWTAARRGRSRRRSPIPRPAPDTSRCPPTAARGCGRRHGRVPYVTPRQGAHWTACAGLPKDTRVVADRVNPKRFYGIALFDGKLFESADGAAPLQRAAAGVAGRAPRRGGSGNGQPHRSRRRSRRPGPASTPRRASKAISGWRHSTASTTRRRGKDFVRIADVERIHGFGFGKAAPGAKGDGEGRRAVLGRARSRRPARLLPLDRRRRHAGCASTTTHISGAWSCTSPATPRSSAASTSAPTAAARSMATRRRVRSDRMRSSDCTSPREGGERSPATGRRVRGTAPR